MMEISTKDNNNNMHDVARTIKELALQQLLKSTGYSLTQINGQRKFGGPPPGWDPHADPPERGCEIFIGKIPRDTFEDELIPVFQRIGKIYEFRLMMDFSGTNRGYAFCTYCEKADAKRAIKEINNFEIKKGRFLGVCSSVDNCRLFIGGIPRMKVREEILSEISKVTEGVVDVIVYPSAMDKSKNRGFAFVEYENHRAAAMARRKLMTGRIQLWGHTIAVDWAEPEPEADEDVMANVRILYIRNLMLSTTEDTIKAKFEEAIRRKDCIERVKKLRDYAFVHFKLREDAVKAMEVVNGTYVDGALVEVVLAKPVDKNEQNAKSKALSQIPGFEVDNTMSAVSSLYGRTLTQISFQGRGRGTRSAGGTKSYSSTINIRRHPVELLEDVSKKSNWGSPSYQLHSAIQRDPVTNTDCQLFLYKVAIPAIPSLTFQPTKLCRTVEEAKIFAAEHTLMQIGIPIERLATNFKEVLNRKRGMCDVTTSASPLPSLVLSSLPLHANDLF